MKVELRVGETVVSCEADHRPDPSGKCSENDAARQAQEIMQPVIAIEQAAAEVKAKMAEATA